MSYKLSLFFVRERERETENAREWWMMWSVIGKRTNTEHKSKGDWMRKARFCYINYLHNSTHKKSRCLLISREYTTCRCSTRIRVIGNEWSEWLYFSFFFPMGQKKNLVKILWQAFDPLRVRISSWNFTHS